MRAVGFIVGVVALVGIAGCSDPPPYIYEMTYSPNAGFTGQMTTIDGMANYTDSANNISQYVVELVDPTGALADRTPPTPIAETDTGVEGQVEFTYIFTPAVSGVYNFYFWIIDLTGRESNHLNGQLRVSDDTM